MGVTWSFVDKCVIAFILLVLAILPLIAGSEYLIHITILAMIFAVFAASWNMVTGFAGLKTFGHQAFFAVGAYVSALTSIHFGWNPWIAMIAGSVAAALAGLLVAIPVLRLKSVPHVAIATLALAEIVRLLLSNFKDVTRGEMGLSEIPGLPMPGIFDDTSSTVAYFYVGLVLFGFGVIAINALMSGKPGLAFLAIRDSQDAAESLGINLALYKTLAFGVSAFLVGVCGAFYAHYIRVLTPSAVGGVELMMLIVSIVLVGGLGTSLGPIILAFVLTIGLELMRGLGEYRLLIYGFLVILFVLRFPRGIASIVQISLEYFRSTIRGLPPVSKEAK